MGDAMNGMFVRNSRCAVNDLLVRLGYSWLIKRYLKKRDQGLGQCDGRVSETTEVTREGPILMRLPSCLPDAL